MYHFIGIKGSGMSALAIIMKRLGYDVQGSDYGKHFFTEDNLIRNEINIFEFNENNIKDGMIIVKGNSFGDDNLEVRIAKSKNLKIYEYQEMVSIITEKYNLITISGCHGKTTTASLISHLIDSNYLIGDGSGGVSQNDFFVLEACEYKRHFLKYNPNFAVITNIDLDHVDYYKNIDDVIDAYQCFISNSNVVIACGDDPNVRKLNHDKIYYYGINDDDDYIAKNIVLNDSGICFDFYDKDCFIYHFDLPFYGVHMLYNSLAAIVLCYLVRIDMDIVVSKLMSFEGAKRRFKETIVFDNVIIDDYAHHPVEIKATIDAARQKYGDKKIVVIFEPHTFSRTQKFFKEISIQLSNADYVYVMDIYPSRERQEDYLNVTSDMIISNLDNVESFSKENLDRLLIHRNSVLIFMSPNDLTDLEDAYKNHYEMLNL
jgi:UDP-N-acetylmuramate--alanine ligase